MKFHSAAFTFLALVTASCSAFHQSPSQPPIDFDPDHLNREIRLLVFNEIPSKTSGPLNAIIEYNTKNQIVLPNDYNLRIFIEQNGEWKEISENPTIRYNDALVLSADDPSSHGNIVGFSPQLDDLNTTYYLRAYIFGEMTTAEGVTAVAAYADFVVTP